MLPFSWEHNFLVWSWLLTRISSKC